MRAKRRLLVASAMALACLSASLARADAPSMCAALSIPRDATMAPPAGMWRELTDLQRAFVEGVFALNPATPPGLPYGDKAVLAQRPGQPGGMIVFVDGDRACTPMTIPDEIVDMLQHIGQGDIRHEPSD